MYGDGTIEHLTIRPLEIGEVARISTAFRDLNKSRAQYERYLSEQQEGVRTTLVAFAGRDFAGYVTINWNPRYPPFRADGIPEIQDFNVLPRFRRRGIGTRLMEEAELIVAERSSVVGIGVGMTPDYGAAQRLYVLRGYVPDGKGLTRDGRSVTPGDEITVNDGLVLYMTKAVTGGPSHSAKHRSLDE